MNILLLDTETTNTIEDALCYDVGYIVLDTESGEILTKKSFVVREIFNDKELMSYAYFKEKIDEYVADINNGTRILANFTSILGCIYRDTKKYNVSEMYAHNVAFDYASLNTTLRYMTSSKRRYALPYNLTICDTLKMCRKCFGKDKDYLDFCETNNFLTKYGKPRFTAEIVYKYLTNDLDFVEEHKGLDDVLIEKEILLACRNKGITNGVLWER